MDLHGKLSLFLTWKKLMATCGMNLSLHPFNRLSIKCFIQIINMHIFNVYTRVTIFVILGYSVNKNRFRVNL